MVFLWFLPITATIATGGSFFLSSPRGLQPHLNWTWSPVARPTGTCWKLTRKAKSGLIMSQNISIDYVYRYIDMIYRYDIYIYIIYIYTLLYCILHFMSIIYHVNMLGRWYWWICRVITVEPCHVAEVLQLHLPLCRMPGGFPWRSSAGRISYDSPWMRREKPVDGHRINGKTIGKP